MLVVCNLPTKLSLSNILTKALFFLPFKLHLICLYKLQTQLQQIMKKSSKRLVISTHAKNSIGFRTRTAGIALAEFTKNPLLLWMHKRPTGESVDEILPLGYWEDIELNGEQLSGVPVFDDTDPFAMKIYNKVENGTIKMASAGLKPVEFKEEADELWLWESSLFEASLCDIGSNPEALAVSLYNENLEVITLSEVYTQNKLNADKMKIKLTATAAKILNLAAGDEMDASTVVESLVTLSEKQAGTITKLTNDLNTAETKLTDAVKLADDNAKNALLDQAQNVDRKITADQRPFLLKMETEELKKYLLTVPASPEVKNLLKGDDKKDDALLKLSYNELDKKGLLIKLKEQNPEAFKEKFKEQFGTDYKE